MSSIAVMQPYFFPYIGYFQLIEAVDTFVFYDDVDFIKNGWINRNRILINDEPKYFTIPCKNVSSYEKIKNIKHGLDQRKRKKLLKKIKFTYSRAPYFEEVYTITQQVLGTETEFISKLAIDSVKKCSIYLGLECSFLKSSVEYENGELDAAERLIDICKLEDKVNYINPIGGKELYSKEYFEEKGINLQFLQPAAKEYDQFGDDFTPWLSIIDVMMFNSPGKIKNELLCLYKLV
jgi:hypothetical protein